MEPESFWRQADCLHHHPYRDLPELECHISPPYVVINTGPKCVGLDLDQVGLNYHESETSDSQRELKHQLQLSCNIWVLLRTQRKQQMLGEGGREKKGGKGRGSEMRMMWIRLR